LQIQRAWQASASPQPHTGDQQGRRRQAKDNCFLFGENG
jgi:hypothetical protein